MLWGIALYVSLQLGGEIPEAKFRNFDQVLDDIIAKDGRFLLGW